MSTAKKRYGEAAVERLLDAAHSVDEQRGAQIPPQAQAADLHDPRKSAASVSAVIHDEKVFNDLWRTVPGKEQRSPRPATSGRRPAQGPCWSCRRKTYLYFMEKIRP